MIDPAGPAESGELVSALAYLSRRHDALSLHSHAIIMIIIRERNWPAHLLHQHQHQHLLPVLPPPPPLQKVSIVQHECHVQWGKGSPRPRCFQATT